MGQKLTAQQEANIIGYAGMKYDGTIILRVRKKAFEGAGDRNLIFCAPGDDHYAEVFGQLGGLLPGETQAVSPWQYN